MTDFPYEDIIGLSRPVSRHHAPMPLLNRGAQFAPFAALRGYDDVIAEASRENVSQIELAEEGQAQLNRQLCLLYERLEEQPEAIFHHYQFDPYTERGAYEFIRGRVRRMDTARQSLTLTDGRELAFSRIYAIEIL